MKSQKKASPSPRSAGSIGAAYAAYPFIDPKATSGKRLDDRKLDGFLRLLSTAQFSRFKAAVGKEAIARAGRAGVNV